MMGSRCSRRCVAISDVRMRRFVELALEGELDYDGILDDDQDWFGRQNLRAGKSAICRAKRNLETYGDAAYRKRRHDAGSLDCRHQSALIEALERDPRMRTWDKLQQVLAVADQNGRTHFL